MPPEKRAKKDILEYGYKKCSRCECILPIIMFGKNKAQVDGFEYYCKDCRKELRDKNKDKKTEYNKEYREKNRDYLIQYDRDRYDSRKEEKQKWRENNRDKIKVYSKRDYEKRKNTEEYKEYKLKCHSDRRGFGCIKLIENPFPPEVEIDWHHINNIFIVPIPRHIHKKSFCGNQTEHRERCNVWMYYLYGIDFNILIGDNND